MKRIAAMLLVGAFTITAMTACNATQKLDGQGSIPAETQTETVSETTAEALPDSGSAEEDGETSAAEAGEETQLDAVAALPGMADDDTAELFGGGTENWTEDKSFYIGRIFETQLYGEPVTIFTTCGTDKTVESVSVKLSDGETEVPEEQIAVWQERISSFTGVEMEDGGIAEESGSRSWKWKTGDAFYTLRLLDKIFSLDIVPAVGELK